MLMWVPCQLTAQFLARMVMPRSRSRSLLSITRSATFSFSAEGAALAQQLVDQRGLAMVDVGDDGDVADLCSWSCRALRVLRIGLSWTASLAPRAG
jgi:hypothetical protein